MFSTLYGAGGAMGLSPRQVDECSLWQLMSAVDGYAKAHGAEEKEGAPEEDEYWAAIDRHLINRTRP